MTTISAPANFRAIVVSSTEIDLSWTKSNVSPAGSFSISEYRIYRGNNLIKTVAASVLAYKDTGLIPGTAYSYRLKAVGQMSPFSATKTVTTKPAPPPPPATSAVSMTIQPGREFRADSYVHTPLADNAALHPNSAAMVARFIEQIANSYQYVDLNINGYSPAIFLAPAGAPTVLVRHVNWDNQPEAGSVIQDRWTAVPLPANFDAAAGTDAEALVYQPSTGTLWEFWVVRKTGARVVNSAGVTVDEWGAIWGGRMDDIGNNPGYWETTPEGVTPGTTASGIPFLAGLITVEEARAGAINHILGFAIPYPGGEHVFPAQRSDGGEYGPSAIPEGTIMRFPAALDLTTFGLDPFALMIAKAIQKHGMICWDMSGSVNIRAENPGPNYPDGDPWFGDGGILGCVGVGGPDDADEQKIYQCWGPKHFETMPWARLQVIMPPVK